MQEETFEELELEKDLEDEKIDPDSAEALEEFFNSINIKNSKDIPALKFVSTKSKKILKNFCIQNNSKIRKSRIVDLYKCLDWIPFNDIDIGVLTKINEKDRKILLKEIKMYLNQKEDKQKQKTEWRKEYKNRVILYYKENIPKQIKIKLESLRDFELNLVGHDRNWQHYFRFKSFKKIDEFLKLSNNDRLKIYDNFKLDVYSYKNNRELNLSWQEEPEVTPGKSWDDDIVNSINWEHKRKAKRNNTSKISDIDLTIIKDYSTLGLAYGSTLKEVKSNYRNLAKKTHPDKPGGCTEKMKALNASYQRVVKFLTNIT